MKDWNAAQVKALRKKMQMSQETFALAVCVTRRTVIKWEQNGVPTRNRLAMRRLDTLR